MSASPNAPHGRRLRRDRDGRPAAPVRIVHLGLGNFFRAHQCWYTEHAPDAGDWGIAAFTGLGVGPAQALAEQDFLYTLVVNGASGSRPQVISSLSAAHSAGDHEQWLGYFASPELAIVTTTVTEAGYCRDADGGLDLGDPAVQRDLRSLRSDPRARVTTAPARLAAGLLARKAAGGGPITVVPCDNVRGNGEMTRRVVTEAAQQVDPSLLAWLGENVSFVTTMVDRITPRATKADQDKLVRLIGVEDPALVVTEPYIEWVLAGDFVAGRPAWEQAGARFVDDVEPYETRKLWLLNGAHSLMGYAGSIRGHESVAQAIADPVVRGWVEQWWVEAASHLEHSTEEVQAYCATLVERFANPQIRDLLARIVEDGSQKLPIVIVPPLKAERAAGRMPAGAIRALAAWLLHLRGAGAPIIDVQADQVVPLAQGDLPVAAEALLRWLDVDDPKVTAAVVADAEQMGRDVRLR